MKNYKSRIIIAGLIIVAAGALFSWKAVFAPVELTLKPDHLDMLVSLDGEWDEYYEELTLKCNGKKVKGEKAVWHSDDPNIAEVDEEGWVTSMGVGTTTITAQYRGATARCVVEVTQKITSDTLGE